jgi:hypothetical protein
MRVQKHVAHVRKIRNARNIFVAKCKICESQALMDGKGLVLRRVLKKDDVRIWTAKIRVRTGTTGGLL